jgi:mRNA interferase RelE/StbE
VKTVSYTKVATRALLRHSNRASLITAKINAYAQSPVPQANNVKQLVGSQAKRLRVGDFRVLFTEDQTTITVLDIGPRGGIYD